MVLLRPEFLRLDVLEQPHLLIMILNRFAGAILLTYHGALVTLLHKRNLIVLVVVCGVLASLVKEKPLVLALDLRLVSNSA